MIEKVSNGDAATRKILDRSPRGVSVVLDPTRHVPGPRSKHAGFPCG
jgi:hypothetical protein